MLLPFTLVLLATGSAAALAYGTHPFWAQFPHGLQIILFSRSLQWLLAGGSLILCLAIAALVISGKRRVWWLLVFGPVLALFVHRFATDPFNAFVPLDDPSFTSADQATFLRDSDYVVGLRFGDTWYAYPFASLYRSPVVLQADHDRRMLLMWSAFANRAVAVTVDRTLRARDLEIVSMPANAILLYNKRLGQFINGLKTQTIDGQKPAGFRSPVFTTKTTWKQWRTDHPNTQVMLSVGPWIPEPSGPLLPYYGMPSVAGASDLPPETRIVLVPTTHPVAIASQSVTATPVNIPAGDLPVLLFRDDTTGAVSAFDRRLDDLFPWFIRLAEPEHPEVAFADMDTHTRWTALGVAVDGPDPQYKGRKLAKLPDIEEDLYWGVMKVWYPDLLLHTPKPPTAAATKLTDSPPERKSTTKPTTRRSRRLSRRHR